jgi:MOSC domain-containing protein YiiM
MKLLSVNVSLPKEVPHERKTVSTSIYKEPVDGRVMLRTMNLDGDGQADLENHGGVYQAAYVYSVENYDHWRRELGRYYLAFGQFGENFTVGGMAEDDIYIGDVFGVGDALVEVTQPRTPCFKLGIKMGMPKFPKMFLSSGRVGFYLRVLREGEVGAGDAFERIEECPERVSVREMSRLLFFEPENLEGAKRALRVRALSPGWRNSFEDHLAKAGEDRDNAAGKESSG